MRRAMSWAKLSADPEMLYRLRPPDRVLAGAMERAGELGQADLSLEAARLLEILAGGASVRRVLEVGRGAGVATLCLARGADRAEIVSLDRGKDLEDVVRTVLDQAEVANRVTLVTGDPLVVLDSLDGAFERIHLAVAATELRRLVDRVLPKLVVGGLLTVSGLGSVSRAAPGEGTADDEARSVAGYLVMHPQLETQVLELTREPGGGLAVARKKQPLVTEMGGPF